MKYVTIQEWPYTLNFTRNYYKICAQGQYRRFFKIEETKCSAVRQSSPNSVPVTQPTMELEPSLFASMHMFNNAWDIEPLLLVSHCSDIQLPVYFVVKDGLC